MGKIAAFCTQAPLVRLNLPMLTAAVALIVPVLITPLPAVSTSVPSDAVIAALMVMLL